jgi:EmrB/QacA subfamily drug resistance transporter
MTGAPAPAAAPVIRDRSRSPWPAMATMCLGFFMILTDGVIVSVATPTLVRDLRADVNTVVWVTSAYLLAFAVPLLITGRLGDRFGPKRIYLIGLAGFTLASLGCALAGSVETLIAARVVQGLAASLISPQTMAVITRVVPAERRGTAMGVWGAVAGLAGVGGPVLGGLLIEPLGWQSVFLVNLPVGLVGFVLAWRLVPALPTHGHRFDVPGVLLSAAAMLCLTYAIQEGSMAWLLLTGLVLLAVFVLVQARFAAEPLVPLSLFRRRNFALANVAIATLAACNAWALPFMLYAQEDRDLGVLQAALLLVPGAVVGGVVSPLAGRYVGRRHPAVLAGSGLGLYATALGALAVLLATAAPLCAVLTAAAFLGVGAGASWTLVSSIASTALPPEIAGAGSGVFNSLRSLGAALGAAGIGAVMQSRLAAQPGGPTGGHAVAMGESLLFCVAVLAVGIVSAACFTSGNLRR